MKTRKMVIALGMVSSLAFLACSGEEGVDGVNGADGTSCYAKALKDSSGFELYCGDEYVGTLKNGEDGDKGDKGAPGENGSNGENGLSAYEVAVANGFTGSEEEWLESLKGDPGAAGTNCEIVNDEGNVVELKCGTQTTTLYKTTVCGNTPYDPSEKFCYGADLYDYCDGKTYNPDKQFCAKFSDESEQVYKMTVIKGTGYSETWMAENLNYETPTGSYCYNDSAKYCKKYGRLYTWATAVGKSEEECGNGMECDLGEGNIRGVCPEGWHLPSKSEWEALLSVVGEEKEDGYFEGAGTMLKSTEGWNGNDDGTSDNGSIT